MKEQPEALRLAAELEACPTINYKPHAAELRRLHAENIAAVSSFLSANDERTKMRAQRDALLAALRAMRVKYGQYACRACDLADAAIAAVEGEKE